jgi:hypothetical protein
MAAKDWRSAYGPIWREATEAVGLGTRDRVLAALTIQGVIGFGIYVALGRSAWASAVGVRLVTAAAPFLAFPILFLWKLIGVPLRRPADLGVAPALAGQALPDMTIRALFFHVDPDLVTEDSRWKAVRDEVMDALSVGRIQCWGRRRKSTIGLGRTFQRTRSPLQEVPRETWRRGDLTMFFLEEGMEQVIHFDGKTDTGQTVHWSDLRMNRAQVEQVWP